MQKIALAALFAALHFLSKTAAQTEIQSVNPFIGTDAHGHTFPGATAPFGMVQLSPDTRLEGWDGCSGYHFSDSIIYGFSHTHLSGTGVEDYCDFLFQPIVGEAVLNNGADGKTGYASVFKKETERAEPGFYSVFLEKPQTQVELTASERVGVHRYFFPKGTKEASVLIDLRHRDLVLDAGLFVNSAIEISGYRNSKSWAAEQHAHFVARFSKPFKIKQLWTLDGEKPTSNKAAATGKKVVGVLTFDVSDGQPLVFAVGLSGVNMDGARLNLDNEFGYPNGSENWSAAFDKTRSKTQAAWQNELSKIEVEGGSKAERTVFYTALYHTMLAPNLWSDADGRYRGRDQHIHHAEGYRIYTVFSLWDTYRALNPLMTLLEPDRVREWMYTFWRQSEEGGLLPVWELAANETDCMIGNHAIPVIADAFLKGLCPDSLAAPLFQAMKKSAMSDRYGLKFYRDLGYIPSDKEPESVSKTIEYSFDDYCIGKMAARLGRDFDADYFSKRAENWKNLLDPQTGFFRARNNGAWYEPFDPTEVNFNFTEANAWQYGFSQHDFLKQKVFFKQPAAARLDSLFHSKPQTTGREQADITGLVGQYAQGNEPSHHMAFLYNSCGEPWKTQALTTQILKQFFTEKPDGIPGNDDCGQMSAWVVWASMGLYPTVPVNGGYDLTQPIFSKIKLKLAGNTTFLIENEAVLKKNEFVWPSGEKTTNRFLLSHDDILNGKNLRLDAQPIPEKPLFDEQPSEPSKRVAVPFVEGERVFSKSQKLTLGCLDSEVNIHFTLDGSEPTTASPIYKKPLFVEKSIVLKAFSILKNGTERSATMNAEFTRQTDRAAWKTSYENPFSKQYTARGERGLVDGLRGGADFRSGGWQGFEGKNLVLTIDFGKKQALKKLTAGFLQDNNSWIFLPSKVIFEISDDGQNWRPAGQALAKNEAEKMGVVLEDFVVELAPTAARFLKITGVSLGKCPDWHKAAGSPCWIFADEILVE